MSMTRLTVACAVAAAATALVPAGPASADDPPPVTAFYVDNTHPGCSDLGPGSPAEPFCTIATGTSRLLPGQTVYVGNGTYPEQVSVPTSGTDTAPVTVAAQPQAAPVVGTSAQAHGIYLPNRSYVTVSGLTVNGTTGDGVYVTGGDHVTLSGLRVSYSGQPNPNEYAKGIKLVGVTASTVAGCVVDHNTDSGIYLAQGATGNLVTGNTVHANARQYTRAAAGIDLRSGPNSVIGNVTRENEDSGIQLYTGSGGSLVVNNVSYRNGDHGIDDFQAADQRIVSNSVYRNATAGINLEGGSTGGLVANNISVDNGLGSPRTVGDIRVDSTAQSGTSVHHNIVFLHAPGAYYVWGTTNYGSLAAFATATGQEAGGLQADPWWANPDGGDFALTAGSPAIDSADATVPGEQPTDQLAVARYDDPAVGNAPSGYDDRGAREAPAGTTDASPRPVLDVTPTSGTAPLSVTANASASTDTDLTGIVSYTFDFGDGTHAGPQAAATAPHTYQEAGTYVLAVSVTDAAGLTSTVGTQIIAGVAGNLVLNSTFEANLTGWMTPDGCTLIRAAAGHNEGWAAELINAPSTARTCTLNDSPNWALKTVAGTYTATASVRASVAGGQLKLRLREYAGSTLVGTATATVIATGDWQQIQVSWPVATAGSTLDLNVYALSQPGGSEFFVDDVSLSSN